MSADEILATSDPMTEKDTDTTTMYLSESTIMETSTNQDTITHYPTTHQHTTHYPTTHQPTTHYTTTHHPTTHYPTTHHPTTHDSQTQDLQTHDSQDEEPTTMQYVDLQMDMTTKKPSGTIWKHIGLLSVRVGRFLNIIWKKRPVKLLYQNLNKKNYDEQKSVLFIENSVG